MKEILKVMAELGLSSVAITYASKVGSVYCYLKHVKNDFLLSHEGVSREKFLKDLSDIMDITDMLKPILDEMGRGDVVKVGEILIGVDKYSLKRIARYPRQFFTLIVNDGIFVTMTQNTDLSKIKELIASEIVSC